MGFKERLKEARKNQNMTQEQLGKLIGVAKSTITGYEKGNSEPDMEKTNKIIQVLHIDANFLFQDAVLEKKLVKSIEESDLLKKYRSLDQRGQQAVLDTLNREFSYVSGGADPNPLSHAHTPNMDKIKEKAEEFANMVRKKQAVPTEK